MYTTDLHQIAGHGHDLRFAIAQGMLPWQPILKQRRRGIPNIAMPMGALAAGMICLYRLEI